MDLTNNQFEQLTALRELPERMRGAVAWLCRCSCGKEVVALRSDLVSGHKKSCGCLRKKSPANTRDMIGHRYGMLVVRERAGSTDKGNALWLCDCDCGNTFTTRGTTLRRWEATSCGCQQLERGKKIKEVLMQDKSIDGVQVPLLTKNVRSDSSTGHKGVYKRVRGGNVTFEANIKVAGKRYFAGPYKRLEDAIAAREELERKHHAPYIKALEEKERMVEWTGTGPWEGWTIEKGMLRSPTGQFYSPNDIEPEKVSRNELMMLIKCPSRQALTDRINRGTVPQPDGRDGRSPWWYRKNIIHLVK